MRKTIGLLLVHVTVGMSGQARVPRLGPWYLALGSRWIAWSANSGQL